jgi:hypothetical protein
MSSINKHLISLQKCLRVLSQLATSTVKRCFLIRNAPSPGNITLCRGQDFATQDKASAALFQDMIPFSLVHRYQLLSEACYILLQGSRRQEVH